MIVIVVITVMRIRGVNCGMAVAVIVVVVIVAAGKKKDRRGAGKEDKFHAVCFGFRDMDLPLISPLVAMRTTRAPMIVTTAA